MKKKKEEKFSKFEITKPKLISMKQIKNDYHTVEVEPKHSSCRRGYLIAIIEETSTLKIFKYL